MPVVYKPLTTPLNALQRHPLNDFWKEKEMERIWQMNTNSNLYSKVNLHTNLISALTASFLCWKEVEICHQ